MISIDVSKNELFLLEVIRNFYFLNTLGYLESLGLNYPEPEVVFVSSKFKRKVHFCLGSSSSNINEYHIEVLIYNTSFTLRKNCINIRNYIKTKYPKVIIPEIVSYENIGEILGNIAIFIRENLMPIIEGKDWEGDYVGIFQKV